MYEPGKAPEQLEKLATVIKCVTDNVEIVFS
jgi:hypothetical protein